jgi:hypothetical protein
MIKDLKLRLVFIPLLGLLIPIGSGIVTFEKYIPLQLFAIFLYFIFTSFTIWYGCKWIHIKLRPAFREKFAPFFNIVLVSIVSAIYGALSGGSLTAIWFLFSKEVFTPAKLLNFIAFVTLAILIFTFVYEILFLNKERELDTKIVNELDKERIDAEMTALQNELDPHFVFNSLNTLNHLIITSPNLAHLYSTRLAQVYRYFLSNKNKELVSLYNELKFIENYFFLLQIRHENKLQLECDIDGEREGKIMVPPCALQTLLENAMKHNEFSFENPLKVKIMLNGNFLLVSNNIKPKPYLTSSSKIGLKNLNSRYKLVCNKNILIENDESTFIVKLPLISNILN